MSHEAFPWQDILNISFGKLKLTPDAFWNMTPYEWSYYIEKHEGSHSNQNNRDLQISKSEVEALMHQLKC